MKELQDSFVKLGYLTQAQVDTGYGQFGPKTESAVENFQKNQKFWVTGKFGEVEQVEVDHYHLNLG